MRGKTYFYCISGKIPESLERHFIKPGLGFALAHVVKVDLSTNTVWVQAHHVAGKPTYALKVAPGNLMPAVGKIIGLTPHLTDDTYSAVLLSSEDNPDTQDL